MSAWFVLNKQAERGFMSCRRGSPRGTEDTIVAEEVRKIPVRKVKEIGDEAFRAVRDYNSPESGSADFSAGQSR
jgi:hypothetical protein